MYYVLYSCYVIGNKCFYSDLSNTDPIRSVTELKYTCIRLSKNEKYDTGKGNLLSTL